MTARYAGYEDLAEIIRHRFTQPGETLKELYGRLVFNILCGNNDDHARNHAIRDNWERVCEEARLSPSDVPYRAERSRGPGDISTTLQIYLVILQRN